MVAPEVQHILEFLEVLRYLEVLEDLEHLEVLSEILLDTLPVPEALLDL